MKFELCYEEKEVFVRLNNLRGLLAFVVMFSHIWGYTGFVPFIPFNKMVTIVVAVFFFLSGYGMMRSFDRKQHYLLSVLKEKIPFLLYISVFSYIIAALMEYIIEQSGTHIDHYTPFSLKRFFTSTNWYVYELIGFYLAFVFVKRFIKEKWQLTWIAILSFLAFLALYHSGLVQSYYNSIIGFWFGMFCYKYSWTDWAKRFKYGWIPAFIVLLGSFLCMFLLAHETILFALIRNIAAVGAIILLLYIVGGGVNVADTFTNFLSRISPELYFYHLPISLLFSFLIKNVWSYIIAVVVASVILATVTNAIDRKVLKILKRSI